MILMDMLTGFSALVFLIYGLNYALSGVDNTEVIGGIVLVLLSIGLLSSLIYL
jgi:hypothetical protein